MAEPIHHVARPAAQPDADLACDFNIATETARSGFRQELARGIVPPIRDLDDGVEVTFTAESWDAVLRYVELESQCCPFLNLSARKSNGAVLLTVTGRPEARDLIRRIFAGDGEPECC